MNKIIRFILLVVKEPRDAGRIIVVFIALAITAALMPPHVKKSKK